MPKEAIAVGAVRRSAAGDEDGGAAAGEAGRTRRRRAPRPSRSRFATVVGGRPRRRPIHSASSTSAAAPATASGVCQSSARCQDAIHAGGMSAGRKGPQMRSHRRSHRQRCSAAAGWRSASNGSAGAASQQRRLLTG
ncbi:MAG: hypothetical protein MZW92_54120 [Comamonadaceae bacterium]|nr:hypothetical protein [Comamonadaceae bacterium]